MVESMIAGSKAWQADQRRLLKESGEGAIRQTMRHDEVPRQRQAEECKDRLESSQGLTTLPITFEMFK